MEYNLTQFCVAIFPNNTVRFIETLLAIPFHLHQSFHARYLLRQFSLRHSEIELPLPQLKIPFFSLAEKNIIFGDYILFRTE